MNTDREYQQVCFTRIGGQESNAGWQVVNASAGLAPGAAASYSLLQNANIYPPIFDSQDAEEQMVTELQVDGEYVFLSRIKYGLLDETGRATMFAHAFVAPLDAFVRRPSCLLDIAPENFSFTVDETRDLPAMLRCYPALTREAAIEGLCLEEGAWQALTQCIYYGVDGKTKNTLHIICDCSFETIHKALTAIYGILPFGFRRKMGFSTYESQGGSFKPLIFERSLKVPDAPYFDLRTGENNLLTDAVKRRLQKYTFIAAAAAGEGLEAEVYFTRLEEMLARFDSTATTSLDLYQIAHDLYLEESGMAGAATPESIRAQLNDLLSVPVRHPYIDELINYVLGRVIEEELDLNDIISEKLCQRLEKTECTLLIETGFEFNARKITRMSVEEGARYLFEAYQDRNSESFQLIMELLEKDQKGVDILVELYASLVAKSLLQEKEAIKGFAHETNGLRDRSRIQETIFSMACACLCQDAQVAQSPHSLMQDAKIFLESVLSERIDLVFQAARQIREAYWTAFTWDKMVLSNPGYYDDVACENEKYQIVQKAAFAYDCFMGRDIAQFWDSLNDLFYGSDGQEPEAQASLIRKMQEACLSVGGKYYGEWELDPWIVLGELELIEKREPIAFLIDNKIPAMVSCFNDAYPHSQLLQDEEQKEEFVGWLNSYLQWQPEGYRFAQDALRIIKAYEKQAQREQKRAEKEMRIEAGKSRFPLSFAPRSKRGQHESMPSDYDDQPW